MLKLLRIRSWIGLMAVLVVGAGIFGMQDRLAGWWASGRSWWHAAQEERDWRQQELVFLKGIYDRLEQQRQAGGGEAASLQREQDAILKRIAETATPIRDKVPPEIRSLLPDAPVADGGKPAPAAPVAAAAPPPAALTAPGAATAGTIPMPAAATVPPAPPVAARPPLPEVRIEPANIPGIEVDLSALSRAPALDRPAERIVKLREPRPAKSADAKPSEPKSGESKSGNGKAAEAKPTEAKSGETKAEAKSGETKPAKPKPAKPKPAAAAPETGGSAKQ